MSLQQQNKICKGCHCSRESCEFLNEKGVILKKCHKCRNNIKRSRSIKNTKEKPNETISYSDITETVYNSLTSLSNTNEVYEGENIELNMSFNVDLSTLVNVILENNGSENIENINCEIGRYIVSLISEGDGYIWVYHIKNQKKNTFLLTYYCNCRADLEKQSVKHPSLDKQRDTPTYLKRHNCRGTINIEILSSLDYINVKYSHKILHPRPVHNKTTPEIQRFIQNNINCLVPEIWCQIQENKIKGYENITVKQIHYWWSIEIHRKYCRNSDQLLSSKLLLTEFNQEIIVNISSSTPALGFLTDLFYQLSQINLDAIEIDATYGTNSMEWELYAIMGVLDGTGFPLSYLLISAGKGRNITGILTIWMQTLKERNLIRFPIILADKDFAEINAAQTVWPEAQIQLCAWHVQRAIKQRLASNKQSIYYSYNPKMAHEECSVIDPNWGVTNISERVFCPLNLRETVIKTVNQHLNRHMLLPKLDGTFVTDENEIWKECVGEIIQFCKDNNLLRLWIYLWKEWYTKSKWNLWARASNEKISHIKTTMIVESHWRHIKRDYLYKFHKPRIDHLCYILVKKVVNQQLHRIQLLQQGRYLVPWRKEFKKEWKLHEKKITEVNGRYLTDSAKWICSCPAYIQSRFFLCKHLIKSVEKADAIFFKKVQRNGNYPLISTYEGEFVNIFHSLDNNTLNISTIRNPVAENNDDYIAKSDDEQHIYETDLAYLCEVLDKTKELLEESCNKPKCHLWLKNVRPNFKSLEKMNDDIRALRNRQTTPRTWKDLNCNTMYWE